ncbi:hypothetical protein Ac2012v2_007350 [Leucoagaricus gongylophorus]
MPSFISIAFAFIAFTTVTSALPTFETTGVEIASPPPEAKPYLSSRADVIDAREPAKATLTTVSLESRGGPAQGIPDILSNLNGKIIPLCHDLSDQVTGTEHADVALRISLDALGKIKGLLGHAKDEIEALVANPVKSVFYLNGRLLDAHAIAQIVAVLTVTVSTALSFVIKACVHVQTDKFTVLVDLVNEIAGILATIIILLVKVAATLVVDLIPLIHCALDIIKALKLTVLAQALNVNI